MARRLRDGRVPSRLESRVHGISPRSRLTRFYALPSSASYRRSLTIIMFNEHKARNTKQGVTGYLVC